MLMPTLNPATLNKTVEANLTLLHVVIMTSALFFHADFSGANLDLIFTTKEDMNNAVPAPSNTASFPGPSAAPSASFALPTPLPANEFRHNLFPLDVKQRCDDHQDPNLVVPVSDLVPSIATTFCPLPCKCFFHSPTLLEKRQLSAMVPSSPLSMILRTSTRLFCVATMLHFTAFALGPDFSLDMAPPVGSTLCPRTSHPRSQWWPGFCFQ